MTYDELWRQLVGVYPPGEAKAIVRYVLDVRFGMSATDVYCGKVTQLSPDEGDELLKIMHRLRRAEPVQYVLGRADFAGRVFEVGPGVLIPRPETEDLCEWAGSSMAARGGGRVLDIGTGSGCVAITLALAEPRAEVSAWDVSPEALDVAGRNARELSARVALELQDALNPPDDADRWDVIVSNPPYICDRERAGMERNVVDYEPHVALFVPDDDPLRFYRAIACYGRRALRPGGELYFEINPLHAGELRRMLGDMGYADIATRPDRFGRERLARAIRIDRQKQEGEGASYL